MKFKNALLFAIALAGVGVTQLPAQVIVESGPARRGYLGFSFQREVINRDGDVTLSLTVMDVVEDAPAARAGLRKGDVILRLNGLNATGELLNSISGSIVPGDTVELRVRRGTAEQDVRVIAQQPPAGYVAARALPLVVERDSVLGMLRVFVDSVRAGLDTTRFRYFHSDSADGSQMFVFADSVMNGDSVVLRRFAHRFPRGAFRFDSAFHSFRADSMLRSLPFDSTFRERLRVLPGEAERFFEFAVPPEGGDRLMVFGMGARAIAGARLETLNSELGRYFEAERGVLVIDVPENTPARRAGLRPGDVITSAAGTRVTNVADVYRAFAQEKQGVVKLEVLRRGERRTLELTK
jgi:membrane-associated protease RseP (regulator of RpoE activity)